MIYESQVTPSNLTQLTQTSGNSWTASTNGLVMVAVTAKCTNCGSVSSDDATYANYFLESLLKLDIADIQIEDEVSL